MSPLLLRLLAVDGIPAVDYSVIKDDLTSFFYRNFFPIAKVLSCIQHCFICRPSDSTVPTDAGIEPRTVATGTLADRRSNHLARSQSLKSAYRICKILQDDFPESRKIAESDFGWTKSSYKSLSRTNLI